MTADKLRAREIEVRDCDKKKKKQKQPAGRSLSRLRCCSIFEIRIEWQTPFISLFHSTFGIQNVVVAPLFAVIIRRRTCADRIFNSVGLCNLHPLLPVQIIMILRRIELVRLCCVAMAHRHFNGAQNETRYFGNGSPLCPTKPPETEIFNDFNQ